MFNIGAFSMLTKFRLNFTTKRKEVETKCCFPLTSHVCNSFGAFSAEPMCSCSIQASSSTARRRKEGGISLPLAYRPVHLMSFGAIFLRTSKFLLITLLAFTSLLVHVFVNLAVYSKQMVCSLAKDISTWCILSLKPLQIYKCLLKMTSVYSVLNLK